MLLGFKDMILKDFSIRLKGDSHQSGQFNGDSHH